MKKYVHAEDFWIYMITSYRNKQTSFCSKQTNYEKQTSCSKQTSYHNKQTNHKLP